MRLLNVKGQPFVADGTEKLVDLSAEVLNIDDWGNVKWKNEPRIPNGRVIIRCASSVGWGGIVSVVFPTSVRRALWRRFKQNPPCFLSEFGFEVPESEKPPFIFSDWEMKDAEENFERRKAREAMNKQLDAGDVTETVPCRLIVPDIGTVLRLAEDWTFDLYEEYRNKSMMNAVGLSYQSRYHPDGMPNWQVTLKAGAMLSVDRVYLRKGAGDYSSLTFFVRSKPEATAVRDGKEYKLAGKFRMPGVSGAVRFWVKLADVNTMMAFFVTETMKVRE
jgi:hypothetical protein